MVTRASKTSTTTTDAPKVASKFALEAELPKGTRIGKALDADLTAALRHSFDTGNVYSLAVSDTPPMTVKGVTTHDVKTAEQFIRRHAVDLGIGVAIRVLPNGRVSFRGQEKKVVPTGAARKPRTRKVTTA